MDAAGERINSSVDFVLADPPYNMRRNPGDAKDAHDSFTEADIVP